LDDELRTIEQVFEEKMEVIKKFEELCKQTVHKKIHDCQNEQAKSSKQKGNSITPAMQKRIERAVFARVIDEELEKNHERVFILRFHIEKTSKLFY